MFNLNLNRLILCCIDCISSVLQGDTVVDCYEVSTSQAFLTQGSTLFTSYLGFFVPDSASMFKIPLLFFFFFFPCILSEPLPDGRLDTRSRRGAQGGAGRHVLRGGPLAPADGQQHRPHQLSSPAQGV